MLLKVPHQYYPFGQCKQWQLKETFHFGLNSVSYPYKYTHNPAEFQFSRPHPFCPLMVIN
jgi:hypothetical protein